MRNIFIKYLPLVFLLVLFLPNSDVTLKLVTATELNNFGFEVERLKDPIADNDKKWITIGFIPGNSTTTEEQTYFSVDKGLQDGKYYYGLKPVNMNSGFEYSNILEVEIVPSDELFLFQNYPNPFNPETTIRYSISSDTHVRFELYNLIGKMIAVLADELQERGQHELKFKSENLLGS